MSTQMTEQGQASPTLRKWLANPEVTETIDNALGGWLTADKFIAQISISFARHDVKKCSPESQYKCAMDLATMGFIPGLDHAALIPRKRTYKDKNTGRRETWMEDGKPVFDLTVMPQWQGYKALMLRDGSVVDVEVELVYDHETYEYDRDTDTLRHTMDPFDTRRDCKSDLSNIKGGYAKITWMDGRVKHHFLTRKDILERRACAETLDIWSKWPKEMAFKAVARSVYARRIVNVDPLVESRLQRAMQIEDRTLGNDPMRAAVVVEQAKDAALGAPQQTRRQQIQEAIEHHSAPPEYDVPASHETVDSTAEPAEKPKPKRKKSTTRKRAEQPEVPKQDAKKGPSMDNPPPPSPPELDEYVQSVMAASSHEEVAELLRQVSTREKMTDELWAAAESVANWKHELISPSGPPDSLFDQ